MADEYIKREDAMNLLHKNWGKYGTSTEAFEVTLHQYRIIPAADVVEAVRCKDCVSFNAEVAVSPWSGVCRFFNNHSVMADGFCSCGERRGNDED